MVAGRFGTFGWLKHWISWKKLLYSNEQRSTDLTAEFLLATMWYSLCASYLLNYEFCVLELWSWFFLVCCCGGVLVSFLTWWRWCRLNCLDWVTRCCCCWALYMMHNYILQTWFFFLIWCFISLHQRHVYVFRFKSVLGPDCPLTTVILVWHEWRALMFGCLVNREVFLHLLPVQKETCHPQQRLHLLIFRRWEIPEKEE